MITTIAQFKLAQAVTTEQAKDLFMQSAAEYRAVEGLIRKYYILADDGKTAGAVYLWESLSSANRNHNEEWYKKLKDKYGSMPSVLFFNTPVVVDNNASAIIED